MNSSALERTLIERCQNGDRDALEQLYDRYAAKLRGICLRYSKSEHEAEDIFQDAFIKILNNLKSYQHKGSFEGWLKRIVINAAIDHIKKYHNFKNHISCDEVNDGERLCAVNPDMLAASELLEIIKKIPSGYNTVFNLFVIEGYTHPEIAGMLNISESTSRSQLSKARNYIKNILRKYDCVNHEERKPR